MKSAQSSSKTSSVGTAGAYGRHAEFFGPVALIFVALAFDFLNGLHDAANSIATVVSTRVLRPQYAVIWAAFFNFIAFLFFGLHVAQTVGTGIVAAEVVDAAVIFGALMGAICWNLITWWVGIPSSSSHALIGGLAGAGMMKAGLTRSSGRVSASPRPPLCCRPCSASSRFVACAHRLMVVRPLDALGRGQYLSHLAAGLGRALFPRAWR